jgi:hypothetical protein
VRIVTGAMAVTTGRPAGPLLKRGDCDGDGEVGLNDVVFLLSYQFLAGPHPVCPDACDADDSGGIDLTDMVLVLRYLFSSGIEPSPPGPSACGPDPTGDDALEPCASGDAVCR